MQPSVCFEVEKIIAVSAGEGSYRTYQVQWAPTWISGFHLLGCEQLIEQFLHQQTKDGDDEEVQDADQFETAGFVEDNHRRVSGSRLYQHNSTSPYPNTTHNTCVRVLDPVDLNVPLQSKGRACSSDEYTSKNSNPNFEWLERSSERLGRSCEELYKDERSCEQIYKDGCETECDERLSSDFDMSIIDTQHTPTEHQQGGVDIEPREELYIDNPADPHRDGPAHYSEELTNEDNDDTTFQCDTFTGIKIKEESDILEEEYQEAESIRLPLDTAVGKDEASYKHLSELNDRTTMLEERNLVKFNHSRFSEVTDGTTMLEESKLAKFAHTHVNEVNNRITMQNESKFVKSPSLDVWKEKLLGYNIYCNFIECQQRFCNPVALMQHMRECKENSSSKLTSWEFIARSKLVCPECQKPMKTDSYDTHYKDKHPKLLSMLQELGIKKAVKCKNDKCEAEITTVMDCVQHFRTCGVSVKSLKPKLCQQYQLPLKTKTPLRTIGNKRMEYVDVAKKVSVGEESSSSELRTGCNISNPVGSSEAVIQTGVKKRKELKLHVLESKRRKLSGNTSSSSTTSKTSDTKVSTIETLGSKVSTIGTSGSGSFHGIQACSFSSPSNAMPNPSELNTTLITPCEARFQTNKVDETVSVSATSPDELAGDSLAITQAPVVASAISKSKSTDWSELSKEDPSSQPVWLSHLLKYNFYCPRASCLQPFYRCHSLVMHMKRCVRRSTDYLCVSVKCPECNQSTSVRKLSGHLFKRHRLLDWYWAELEADMWAVCQNYKCAKYMGDAGECMEHYRRCDYLWKCKHCNIEYSNEYHVKCHHCQTTSEEEEEEEEVERENSVESNKENSSNAGNAGDDRDGDKCDKGVSTKVGRADGREGECRKS